MIIIKASSRMAYPAFADYVNSCGLFAYIKAPAYLVSPKGVSHAMAFLDKTKNKQVNLLKLLQNKPKLVVDENNSFCDVDGFLTEESFKSIEIESNRSIFDVALFLHQQLFVCENILSGLESFIVYEFNGFIFAQMKATYFSDDVEKTFAIC